MPQKRKPASFQPRTHARLISMYDGFGDSMDKVVNRLLNFYHKYHGRVERLEELEEFYKKWKDKVE